MAPSAKQNYAFAKEEMDQVLLRGGYSPHSVPKERISGTKRTFVSAWKTPKSERILVLVRTQEEVGTAAQKVPFFILALWDIFRKKTDIDRAYIVLCGHSEAWTLRDVFQDAAQRLAGVRLQVLTENEFVNRVGNGEL